MPMKICLILEGSYPYVHGGVSTWMYQYITEMKEHEFVLWVVGATHEQKGKFVYELPENVVEVHEVFLDYVVPDKEEDIEPHQFTDEEKQALKDMVFCQQPDWKVLFKLLQDGKVVPNDLLSSEAFFQVLKDLCSERYTQLSFSDVFHTIRSMLFPLLNILSCPPPKADVYHSISTGYGGILATLGSLTYDKPLFLTEHGIYTREREEELLRAKWVLPTMRQQWVRFFYMLSDAIYQNAEKITSLFTKAKEIQIEMGCDPEKCQVISNGIDYDAFSQIPLKEPDGWIDIGAVVRLAPIKDIKTMLYSFYELAQQVPNVRLHIMGGIDDQEYADECFSLADKMDLGDRLLFTGRVNIREYMKKIDFTLLTSLSEGLPLSVLESMAASRPCVTTDVGCCRELLEGREDDNLGIAGFCVPPTCTGPLAEAMKKMAINDARRLEMGEIARKRVEAIYQYPQMIGQYRRLYEEVTV